VRFQDILDSQEKQEEDESNHKAPDSTSDEILDELPDNLSSQHSKSEAGKLHNLMIFEYLLHIQEDSVYCSLLSYLMSRASSVSIVTDYGLDNRGLIPVRGRGFFF
jgi:hypothetical protein